MHTLVPIHDPLTSLIFISGLIILIYCLGVWAGRNLERHIVADRLKAIEKAKKAKENRRRRY